MKEMVFLCIESVKMEKWVCFIDASMRGLTALLEMDWFTLVWSADVPWNLRGHISTFFSNSLPNGSFPSIVTSLIPTTADSGDAQPWRSAQNCKVFPWERSLHQPQLQMRTSKKRQENYLEQMWQHNLVFQTPVCFSVHLFLLPHYLFQKLDYH